MHGRRDRRIEDDAGQVFRIVASLADRIDGGDVARPERRLAPGPRRGQRQRRSPGHHAQRIWPGKRKAIVADLGGGPNGAAIGPDGYCYVANNGGFSFAPRADGRWVTTGTPDDYVTGRIERVNIETGKFEVLYDKVGDRNIRGPNDLVFDAHGGFYFTDPGKTRHRDWDRGSVCYAKADGSLIREIIQPIHKPNGIGLSPDGKTLYVAETESARLWAWDLKGPGEALQTRHRVADFTARQPSCVWVADVPAVRLARRRGERQYLHWNAGPRRHLGHRSQHEHRRIHPGAGRHARDEHLLRRPGSAHGVYHPIVRGSALSYLRRSDHDASLDGAITLLEELLASEGDSAEVHAARARAFIKKYRNTSERSWEIRAAQACERAAQLDRDAPEVRLALGELHEATGRFGDALAELDRALAVTPDLYEAHLVRALALDGAQRGDESEQSCRRAIVLQSDDWRGYYTLGLLLFRHGRYAEAVGPWRRVTELTPDNAGSHRNLGSAFFHLDRFDEALDAFRRSNDVRPNAISACDIPVQACPRAGCRVWDVITYLAAAAAWADREHPRKRVSRVD